MRSYGYLTLPEGALSESSGHSIVPNSNDLVLLPFHGQRQDFPCGPVAKTPHSQCRESGSTPRQGARSHMLQLRVLTPQLKVQLRPGAAKEINNDFLKAFF